MPFCTCQQINPTIPVTMIYVNGPVYKGDWCPPEQHVQHGIAILLHQWKECCQNNGKST